MFSFSNPFNNNMGIIGTDDIMQKGKHDPRRYPYDVYGNENPYYEPFYKQQYNRQTRYPNGEKRSMHAEDWITLAQNLLGKWGI
jgi:hypothetical protein